MHLSEREIGLFQSSWWPLTTSSNSYRNTLTHRKRKGKENQGGKILRFLIILCHLVFADSFCTIHSTTVWSSVNLYKLSSWSWSISGVHFQLSELNANSPDVTDFVESEMEEKQPSVDGENFQALCASEWCYEPTFRLPQPVQISSSGYFAHGWWVKEIKSL